MSTIVSIGFLMLRSLLRPALLNPVLEDSIIVLNIEVCSPKLIRGVTTLPRPASGEKQNSSGNRETLEFCREI